MRDIAGCFSGVWGGGLRFGEESCLCIALCAIARHSLLVVGQGCGLQPFAACSAAGGQRNSLAQRSGCFLHRALRDCAA